MSEFFSGELWPPRGLDDRGESDAAPLVYVGGGSARHDAPGALRVDVLGMKREDPVSGRIALRIEAHAKHTRAWTCRSETDP